MITIVFIKLYIILSGNNNRTGYSCLLPNLSTVNSLLSEIDLKSVSSRSFILKYDDSKVLFSAVIGAPYFSDSEEIALDTTSEIRSQTSSVLRDEQRFSDTRDSSQIALPSASPDMPVPSSRNPNTSQIIFGSGVQEQSTEQHTSTLCTISGYIGESSDIVDTSVNKSL